MDDGAPITMETVIEQLKHHRLTHKDWAEWLEKKPADPRAASVGDAAFHRRVEQHYDRMIEFLTTNQLADGIRNRRYRTTG